MLNYFSINKLYQQMSHSLPIDINARVAVLFHLCVSQPPRLNTQGSTIGLCFHQLGCEGVQNPDTVREYLPVRFETIK